MDESNVKPIPASKKLSTPNERTRARLERAKRRRTDLARLLSPEGICDSCTQVFPHEELAIDHVDGRDWEPHKLSPQMRAARYWREYKAGVRLRAICNSCNGQEGGNRRYGGRR